jgi:hypothetical protein
MTTVITYHTVKQSPMTTVITYHTVKQSPTTTVITYHTVKQLPMTIVINDCLTMIGNNCSQVTVGLCGR